MNHKCGYEAHNIDHTSVYHANMQWRKHVWLVKCWTIYPLNNDSIYLDNMKEKHVKGKPLLLWPEIFDHAMMTTAHTNQSYHLCILHSHTLYSH